MENGSFQTQLVSIMEILAKAALAEINRRVDDSCAVLRLEITQSQRDIYSLKKKCELMEAELRRTRMRAKRKGIYTPVADRGSPSVKVVLNKVASAVSWAREKTAEHSGAPQCVDTEPQSAGVAHVIPIKEETAEEGTWKTNLRVEPSPGDREPPVPVDQQPVQVEVERFHSEDQAVSGCLLPSTDVYSSFPEQPANENHDYRAHLVVKQENEDEQEKAGAPIAADHAFFAEEAERQLWLSDPGVAAGDAHFSYAAQQYESGPALFGCPSSSPVSPAAATDDTGPPVHSVAKPHSASISTARVKKRARNFGFKRQAPLLPEERLTHIDSFNTLNSSDSSGLTQQQYGAATADVHQGLTSPGPANSGFGRTAFGLVRRMRTPWRTGIGEKRFGCTYCGKSFMRFSQLKEHLRSHTGEKPFSCLQCGRSFTKQCNLIRHAVVHSGEKPYQCALCGKCFTQRSSLKSHQKTVH